MHNNIMAAGSKERPPMLGPGRYSQWHSRFLRYLDTKTNGEYLRKCIFDGPYLPTNVLIAAVEAAENILPVAAHEEVETIHNMTAENKLYFQAEKEAIFLILTGIGDEIYSTVDACNTAKEMWTAIEKRLQQGGIVIERTRSKAQSICEFGKFTSRDGESRSHITPGLKLMNVVDKNNLASFTQCKHQNLKEFELQPSYFNHLPHDQVLYQTQSKERRHYHFLFSSIESVSFLRKHDPNKLGGIRIAKRTCNSLLSTIKNAVQTYQQQPFNSRSSNSRNKTEDTTPRINKDNHHGQFGSRRDDSCWGYGNKAKSVSATKWENSALTFKGIWTLCRECKETKAGYIRLPTQEKMMIANKLKQGVPHTIADWLKTRMKEI
ncbi:hypothetical protein Tco_1203531 [Tanacetum coccineum]